MPALYRVENDFRDQEFCYVVSRSGDLGKIIVSDIDTAYRLADMLNHHALRKALTEARDLLDAAPVPDQLTLIGL